MTTPPAPRLIGPDAARGLALLGIVIANTVHYLSGSDQTVLFKQRTTVPWDRAADVLAAVLVDNRLLPLFALLFGWGLGVLWRRSHDRGDRAPLTRLLLWRRCLVLLGIGLLHGLLLFSGDIVHAYALFGLLLVLLIPRHPVVLGLTSLVGVLGLVAWGWFDGTSGLVSGLVPPVVPEVVAPTYGQSLLQRGQALGWSLLTAPLADIGLLTPLALGALAARVRFLEDLARWRPWLRRLALWGLVASVLGALPLAAILAVPSLVPAPGAAPGAMPGTGAGSPLAEIVLGLLGVLHQVTGVAGAAGIAALCALLADRPASRRALQPLAALGRISLTAYVAQSLIAAPLYSAWGLGLGGTVGSATATVISLGIWLLTLALAVLLARTGRRGPLEMVLRRLGRV
ncbi:DUF418 domain-containing protein [Brachybacterium sp. EF45031]|uniref:DUF418 domain-containing protein n=1 Tax=Brachybacterium sillae TaxID=2810536 RepID=UPI00217EA850|nr:DUF418 domain-containing protein [Brachybacterium sillae]MCS6711420.1 DUF418 domain-containing protein [Brachybacterium sillae]